MSLRALRAVRSLAFGGLTALAPVVGATPLDAVAYERVDVGLGGAVASTHDLDPKGEYRARYGSDRPGAAPLVGATLDAGYRFTRSFKLDASIVVMHASGLAGSPPYQEERSATLFRFPVLATIVIPATPLLEMDVSAGIGLFHGVASKYGRDYPGATELTGVLVEGRLGLCIHVAAELDAVLRLSGFYGIGFLSREFGDAYAFPLSLGLRYRF